MRVDHVCVYFCVILIRLVQVCVCVCVQVVSMFLQTFLCSCMFLSVFIYMCHNKSLENMFELILHSHVHHCLTNGSVSSLNDG